MGICHLFGGFAIDGSNADYFGQEGVDKHGKGVLQITEGKFCQESGESIVAGYFYFSEAQNFLSLLKCCFVHRSISAGMCNVGEESEEDEGEDCGKGM